MLYRADAFGLPVDLAARLQGAAKPSTALIHELTIKNAGKAVEESPLIAFIGESSTVSVKSFGEVDIVHMSRPVGFVTARLSIDRPRYKQNQ